MAVSPANDDVLFDKWVGWLRIIQDDVGDLLADRTVWREITSVIEANGEIPERWFLHNWITQQAVATMALGIRRQADRSNDVVSLARLLQEMKKHPNVITRDRFAGLCSPGDDQYFAEIVDHNFDQWAGPNGAHVDPARVAVRLHDLLASVRSVHSYATKRLAHTVEMVAPPTFTFGDLNTALGEIGDCLVSLYLLFTCESLVSAEPAIQNPWQRAFVIPWASQENIERWAAIQEFGARRPTEES